MNKKFIEVAYMPNWQAKQMLEYASSIKAKLDRAKDLIKIENNKTVELAYESECMHCINVAERELRGLVELFGGRLPEGEKAKND